MRSSVYNLGVRKAKGKRGRPTILTRRVERIITRAVALGMPLSIACYRAGIPERTVFLWKQLGEKGKQPYARFLHAVKKAESTMVDRCLGIIDKAAEKQWTAAAWRLERIHPDVYSRPPLVKLEPSHLSDEELEKRIRTLVDRVGLPDLAEGSKRGKGAGEATGR